MISKRGKKVVVVRYPHSRRNEFYYKAILTYMWVPNSFLLKGWFHIVVSRADTMHDAWMNIRDNFETDRTKPQKIVKTYQVWRYRK